MADVLLGTAIDMLVKLLLEEAKSLNGVAGDIESLRGEFQIIKSFLNDIDTRSSGEHTDHTVKTWVRQVRDEAERINDVVDQYRSLEAELRSQCCGVKSFARRRFFASEIQNVKRSLVDLKDRAQRYGIKPLQRPVVSAADCDPRLSSLFVEEDELVGVDLASSELIARLVGGQSERLLAWLVGQGGIGKTTLARKVFNDKAVKKHFDCRAWITVSGPYDAHRLLKLTGIQLCPSAKFTWETSVEWLIDCLRDNLRNKKYLVVFDDVWQLNFWEVMKHALPSNGKASRVIMTTRNRSNAHSIKETPFDFAKELKTWSSEPAWELFRKRAFRFELQGNCPEELEDLSRQILSQCHGLPLVIAAIAGMLSSKEKSVEEWKKVADNLNNELGTNPQLSSISRILSLSYHDLPYHLKQCFLYFGMFPEDRTIFEGKLYRLWAAEGFIDPAKDRTSDQVAEEYLKELIHRNLVSVEIKYGYKKWCQIHALMHEIILTAGEELSFLRIVSENNQDRSGKYRRLSVQNATSKALNTVGEDYGARSVFLFNVDAEFAESFAVDLLKNFRLLKVLDFQWAPIDRLPEEVCNLFHLEYLNLKGTSLKVLPGSIGNLQNLLTLDVRVTSIDHLPFEIYKLHKLQHLLVYRPDEELHYNSTSSPGVTMPEGIRSLQQLQTLTHVKLRRFQDDFIIDLGNLQYLKLLCLSLCNAEHARTVGESIGSMKSLEDLSLSCKFEGEGLDFDGASSPPPSLKYLSLKCRLRGLPKWVSELQSLRGLSLRLSRLSDDPLRHVGRLPSLVFLRLCQAFDGEELHFEEGGFRQLRHLKMHDMKGLKRVRIDRGALPLLEDMSFGDFPSMNDVSFDIQHLTSLKSLEIVNMGTEFVASLQPDGGPEYWRIEHVPSVRFDSLLQRLRR